MDGMMFPQVCFNCKKPPCMEACRRKAIIKDAATGWVTIDRERCNNCALCIAACPYDARFIHPVGYADKCTFCDHRVKAGLKPGCASTCPTKAINFGDLDEPGSNLHKLMHGRVVKPLKPDAGTNPNIFFLL